MANEYASVGDVKAAAMLEGETFADADIQRALTAASRGLDNLCSRRFYADADATQVRYYTPYDACTLSIDDLVTFTSLATDTAADGTFATSWTQNTDFVLEPLNAAADGRPYDRITLTGRGHGFTDGVRSVKLTGKFGWSEVPAGVKEAAIILAVKIVKRVREAPFGVVAVGMDSAMRIARSDPDVMFLVGEYIKNPVVVA